MKNITNKNVSTTEIITTMRTATFTAAMTSVAHLALRGDPRNLANWDIAWQPLKGSIWKARDPKP